jgi:excisionase family DNA binding protein
MIAPIRSDVPKLALTAAEAAEALGVSERHITALVARDEIPHAYLGHRIIFPLEPLQEFLRSKCERFLPPGQQEAAQLPREAS